jgi:SAM-dependent methyltransferase
MVVREYDLTWEPPPNTDLLVTHEHFAQPELTLLRRTMERNVPVLLLADGIAEYRNTWEVPDRVPGQQFQPLMGLKIACLGPTQAELYESWGNAGRCEVVGYPSFDPLAGRKKACRAQSGAFRLLVMTARNPYFTLEHHELLCRGLSDLQAWLREHPTHGGRPIEVNWRLTADLEQQFGVANHKRDFYACPLEEIAAEMDAVITTPSTAMLIPMLMGIPTALLDYFGRPLYVQAAWRISDRGQIGDVVSAMLDGDPESLRVQSLILHEALFLGQPARERLRLLMDAMCRAGRRRRQSGGALRLPYRILGGAGAVDAPDEDVPEYPAEDRVAVLRREIMHLLRAYDCDSRWLEADRTGRIDAFRQDLCGRSRAQSQLARYRFVSQYVKGKTVLDIACGTGWGSCLLAREGMAASVIGVDPDLEAVDYARRKFGRGNVAFLRAPATAIPVPAGHFDLVVSSHGLEDILRDEKILSEQVRVLGEGGLVILSALDARNLPDSEQGCTSLMQLLSRNFEIESTCFQNWQVSGSPENDTAMPSLTSATSAAGEPAGSFVLVARKREPR